MVPECQQTETSEVDGLDGVVSGTVSTGVKTYTRVAVGDVDVHTYYGRGRRFRSVRVRRPGVSVRT